MINSTKVYFKFTLGMLGVVTIALFSSCGMGAEEKEEAPTTASSTQALGYPCGSGYTCYPLPCKVGDTQNGDHCVGDLVQPAPTPGTK